MDQVIIRVDKQDWDIRDCNKSARLQYYNTLSKGEVVSLLEKYVVDEFGQK